MTAMNVANLPPALVRSGRVELWLETRLPSPDARRAILADRLASPPPVIGPVDIDLLVSATEGFTGADLKRLVDDAKLLFARDRVAGVLPTAADDYFLAAVSTIRANRQMYAEAESASREQRRWSE